MRLDEMDIIREREKEKKKISEERSGKIKILRSRKERKEAYWWEAGVQSGGCLAHAGAQTNLPGKMKFPLFLINP